MYPGVYPYIALGTDTQITILRTDILMGSLTRAVVLERLVLFGRKVDTYPLSAIRLVPGTIVNAVHGCVPRIPAQHFRTSH